METVIILGAGQFGRGAARLLNQENMALLAFGELCFSSVLTIFFGLFI